MATPPRGSTTTTTTTTKPGYGEVEIRAFANSSSIATLTSSYPLRLVSPPARGHARAAIVFSLTFGGGLVAGDYVDMRVRVQPKARLVLLTQGSTKIYKTPSRAVCTEQHLTATVDEGAALVLLPDPVQPFQCSSYSQSQAFYVHPQHSSLLLLDWVSAGRAARGEAWSFFQWRRRNEVWSLAGDKNNDQKTKDDDDDNNNNNNNNKAARAKLLLRDNIILDGHDLASVEHRYRDAMDDLGVFGTLIIRGPVFDRLARHFLQEFSCLPRIRGKPNHLELATSSSPAGLTWSAASIRGFVMVKFGAKEVDEAKRWLREMLVSEGTVEQEFGRYSLLCLQ